MTCPDIIRTRDKSTCEEYSVQRKFLRDVSETDYKFVLLPGEKMYGRHAMLYCEVLPDWRKSYFHPYGERYEESGREATCRKA